MLNKTTSNQTMINFVIYPKPMLKHYEFNFQTFIYSINF